MSSKFQVFISSTYEDLRAERDIAIKAMLEMGHIPVGMEMFSAADEQQWELIKRQIDDTDYYIVIVAHRYGSIDGTHSYTEKEYTYAIDKGIPVLGFVIDNSVSWPPAFIDVDPAVKNRLDQFKVRIKEKTVNFWKNADDLHAKVSIAVGKAVTAYPRPGWTRATALVGAEVTNELSRLSKENAQLRAHIESANKEAKLSEAKNAKIAKILSLLTHNIVNTYVGYSDSPGFTKCKPVSLLSIFEHMAPIMLVEGSTSQIAEYLGFALSTLEDSSKVRAKCPVPENSLRDWFAYFRALGLMSPSTKKHSVKDAEEYWSLTEDGAKLHSEILVGQLETGLNMPSADALRIADTQAPPNR